MVNSKKRIIVDTDIGVDDAVALCMLLKLAERQNFEVKLITLTHGNVSLDKVAVNIAICCAACGLTSATKPKIVRGASGPLRPDPQKAPITAAEFHGKDGLGNATSKLQVPETGLLPPPGPEDGAADAIVAEVREAKQAGQELHFISLGPLTNLAKAVAKDPLVAQGVTRVVVMGGCGNQHGNAPHDTNFRIQEFNIIADPEAAQEVFSQTWKELVVIPWELCIEQAIPWADFDATFYSRDTGPTKRSEVLKFLATALEFSYVRSRRDIQPEKFKEYTEHDEANSFSNWLNYFHLNFHLCASHGVQHVLESQLELILESKPPPVDTTKGAVLCDAVAAAVALYPEVLTVHQKVNVAVELTGKLTRGMTVVDWGSRSDGDAVVYRDDKKHRALWGQQVNLDLFKQLLRQTIASPSSPASAVAVPTSQPQTAKPASQPGPRMNPSLSGPSTSTAPPAVTVTEPVSPVSAPSRGPSMGPRMSSSGGPSPGGAPPAGAAAAPAPVAPPVALGTTAPPVATAV